MATKQPTLLQQFRSFCFQNSAVDFEQAVEYFAVFGGMGWRVDFSLPLEAIIEDKILTNYRYIHGDIAHTTQSNHLYHRLLSALAVGDRREHSAFRRVKAQREEGEEAIDFLIKNEILMFDKSVEKPLHESDANSDKVLFVHPFMRFWFAFISPYYKSIKEGDYTEMMRHWHQNQQEFTTLIYTQLVIALLKESMLEDKIVKIGGYWDKNVEIDILAKTSSGKLIAGVCKYGKAKTNKSELTKLKAKCEQAELKIETYVLFSKNKFSTELRKEKGADVALWSLKNLFVLVDGLSEADLLENTNKKY